MSQRAFGMSVSVALFAALAATACGDDDASELADSGTDGDSDSDSDTDTDSGPDTDTDTDTDSEIHLIDYWEWNEATLPDELGVCAEYTWVPDIWAVAVDNVVICDSGGGGSGLLTEFDGSSFFAPTLPLGVDDFSCSGVWGNGEDVWVWGYLQIGTESQFGVLRRDSTAWVEEPVEGFESCATAEEYCSIQAMYTDASGLPHAVGWTDADWISPTTGTRVVWEKDVDAGVWALDAEAIFPGFDLLGSLGVVSGPVTLWYGWGADSSPKVFEVDTDIVDLGCSAENVACLDRSGTGEVLAYTAVEVLRYDGAAWSTEASDSCYSEDWDSSEDCWSTGAIDAEGNAYLAGGLGGFGDLGNGQWRVDRWDGTALTEILEPCPGDGPYCGVSDLSVTGDRLYAMARRNNDCVLLWTDLP